MGLSSSSYWLSYFTVQVFIAILTSLVSIVSALAFGFKLFTDSPFIVLFLLFLAFYLSMGILAFFIATLTSTVKTATSLAYGIFLFAIVL